MTPMGMPPNLHKQNKWNHTWLIKSYKCFNSPCYIGTLIRTMGQGYTWLFHIQQSLPIRPRFPQMNHGQRNHLAKYLCCLQRNTLSTTPYKWSKFSVGIIHQTYVDKFTLDGCNNSLYGLCMTDMVPVTTEVYDSSNKACRLLHRDQAIFFSLASCIKLMLRLSAPKGMTRTRPYKVFMHDAGHLETRRCFVC